MSENIEYVMDLESENARLKDYIKTLETKLLSRENAMAAVLRGAAELREENELLQETRSQS